MEFAIATSGFSTPPSLHGKRGFVVGIANEASIAAGCARAFAAAGATLAATYLNDKAQPYVRAVTDPLEQVAVAVRCAGSGPTGGCFSRLDPSAPELPAASTASTNSSLPPPPRHLATI